jgi:hypothetical protein
MSVFISMLYAAFGVDVAELLLQGIIRILGEEAAKLHYLAISLAVFFVISVMFLDLSERGLRSQLVSNRANRSDQVFFGVYWAWGLPFYSSSSQMASRAPFNLIPVAVFFCLLLCCSCLVW